MSEKSGSDQIGGQRIPVFDLNQPSLGPCIRIRRTDPYRFGVRGSLRLTL